MDDFEEEVGNDRADESPRQRAADRGVIIRVDITRKGGRLRVPANVEQFESLEDVREQLLAGGNVILALRFNILGRRGSDPADDLRIGLLLRAATCPPC